MSQVLWPGALGLPQLPFKRLFTPVKRPVPSGAQIVTAYTDGKVTLRSNRAKIGYHEAADTSTYLGVNRGDFVVHGLDIMRGSVGVSDSDGVISPVCTVCVPTGLIEPRYAAYAMRVQAASGYPRALARGVREGGADFRRWDTLAELPLPVPQLEYQRKASDFLDRETAKIDAFIAKNEQLIALLTERRTAVLRVATSIGIEPNREVVDSGITELGVIAADWRLMRLSLLFGSTGSGTTPPAELVLDADEADIPWVTTSELREARISTTLRGVSARTLAATPALKVHPKGSLLLAMYGATIGRTAVLDVPAASNQAVCALSRPRDCDVQYVEYALQAGRERLMLEAVGGGQPNINQEAVRAFRIPVPPLAEQRAIVTDIATKTAAIDSGIAAAKRAIELARERRAALISAAVTGKIDVGVDA